MSTTQAAKHTEGPWKLHSHMGEHFVTGGNPSFLIAHASNGRTHHEPDEANARLISAAPELLEALREVLSLCAVGDVDESTEALGWGLTVQAANAAIAKATGEA